MKDQIIFQDTRIKTKRTKEGKRFKQTFRSSLEKRFSAKYPQLINEELLMTYTSEYNPDFISPGNLLRLMKGERAYIVETKGYLSPSDKSKMSKVVKQFPNVHFVMVFQKGVKKRKLSGTKTTHEEWCAKNGILCYEEWEDLPDHIVE